MKQTPSGRAFSHASSQESRRRNSENRHLREQASASVDILCDSVQIAFYRRSMCGREGKKTAGGEEGGETEAASVQVRGKRGLLSLPAPAFSNRRKYFCV